MAKKPFSCRLETETIRLIKRKAKEIKGSQADAITHWAHGMTVTVQTSPNATLKVTTLNPSGR